MQILQKDNSEVMVIKKEIGTTASSDMFLKKTVLRQIPECLCLIKIILHTLDEIYFRLVFFHDACLGLDDPDVHKAKNKVLKDVILECF